MIGPWSAHPKLIGINQIDVFRDAARSKMLELRVRAPGFGSTGLSVGGSGSGCTARQAVQRLEIERIRRDRLVQY